MRIRYTRVYLLGWLLTMTIGLVCADAADVYLSISRGGGASTCNRRSNPRLL